LSMLLECYSRIDELERKIDQIITEE
jgi:hypothetical protein